MSFRQEHGKLEETEGQKQTDYNIVWLAFHMDFKDWNSGLPPCKTSAIIHWAILATLFNFNIWNLEGFGDFPPAFSINGISMSIQFSLDWLSHLQVQ